MSGVPTREQVSAGGVVYRRLGGRVEVALISVGERGRWQLPKGLVGRGETPEDAALREVREETGLAGELLSRIKTVEYWFFAPSPRGRVRVHKFVHFYLLRYRDGSTEDHDDEVNEARWVEIGEAVRLLAFKGERQVVERAAEMIGTMNAER